MIPLVMPARIVLELDQTVALADVYSKPTRESEYNFGGAIKLSMKMAF